MKKNVAGQVIGAQMNSRTDGSPIVLDSPSVVVYVTGDNGTQIFAGVATHKGNGFWTYAPTQGQTNFDHVAFTFEHPDAVVVTPQAYTTFPQTGDSFARVNTGIPNVAPGANGGLPTVDASNRIAGIQGTLNTLDGLDTAQDTQHGTTRTLITDRSLAAADYATAAAIAALNNLSQAQAQAAAAAALVAYDPPTNAEMIARTLVAASYATAVDIVTVLNAIAGLNNLSSADAQAAVAAALAVTRAEPGQGAPGSTVSPLLKIDYLYQWARNKSAVTDSEVRRYADNGTTIAQKAAHATVGGVYTREEMTTGA